MPNYCDGYIRVRGYKDNVDEFIRILQADYSYMNGKEYCSASSHFYRVFEAEPEIQQIVTGVIKYAEIRVMVAWSVWVCMFPGPGCYYSDNEGACKYATHIIRESQRLQLDIEIWSYEPGLGFQEHYRLNSGVLYKNEDYSYISEYIGDMDYDEFKDKLGDKYPMIKSEHIFKEFQQDNEILVTEMQEETWDFDEDEPPKYLAKNVMCKEVL